MVKTTHLTTKLSALALAIALTGCGSDLEPSAGDSNGPQFTPPTVTSTAGEAASVDELYSYKFIATDGEQSASELTTSVTIPNDATWLSYDASSSTLSGTPVEGDTWSEAEVVFEVSDGTFTTTQEISIQVIPPGNHAPEFTSEPGTFALFDAAYRYQAQATDLNRDSVTYSINDLPAWLTFDVNSGVLTGTPFEADAGNTPITITASDGVNETVQAFAIFAGDSLPVGQQPAFSVFKNAEVAGWPLWDCCAGSTPEVIEDDAIHNEVISFAINGDTVVGFDSRDAGTPFDATDIAGGTISFDIKMTNGPANGATDWIFKIESSDGSSPGDIVLPNQPEQGAWISNSFSLADLEAQGLVLNDIAVIMVFPAWGTGTGAEFLLDNVDFYDVDETAVVADFVLFDNEVVPGWPLWDCCAGSTPEVIVDDAIHNEVISFAINGDTVVGFDSRDAGTPYDASAIAGGTVSFDVKMVNGPTNGTTDWIFKIESSDGSSPGDIVLPNQPVQDAWISNTFSIDELEAQGLVINDIAVFMVFPAWGTGTGAEFLLDNVKFFPPAPTEIVAATPEFVVFGEEVVPGWPLWDCCAGSTPEVVADDALHNQVISYAINGDTVVGFDSRDAGTPYDASVIADGTISFDIKMTSGPTNGTTDWIFKVESSDGSTPGDIVLPNQPVQDAWISNSFSLADLEAQGLVLNDIAVLMVFPAWGTGTGAEFLLDNVKFFAAE